MERKSLQDRKSSIQLFVLVFAVFGFLNMATNCYSAAMAEIVNEGIMTKSQTGLITAVFYLVYAPFQIVGGIAADRYSPSRLIFIGLVGAGAANLFIYFVQDYEIMMLIWALSGVVQFGVWPSIFRIVTTQLVPNHRIKCMFYITMSSVFGLLISYLCTIMVNHWKDNFLVSSFSLFFMAILFAPCYYKLEKKMKPEKAIMTENSGKAKAGWKLYVLSGVPLLLIAYMIHSMLNLGIKALTPVMLMESYQTVTPVIGNALNIILIAVGPIGLILSRIRMFQAFNPVRIISFFFGCSIPLLALIMYVGTIPILLIILALSILAILIAMLSMFFSYISVGFAKFGSVATLSGLFNCMASLGIVIANFWFAKLADNAGWGITTGIWLILGIAALIMSMVTVPLWKRFLKVTDQYESNRNLS